ncbi:MULTISPECIES: Gp138 family membrane-puncturing spike protein [Achromobacter]|uniref:Gp138 family membrane-puncturing spike protein n=1 Tax=Achromobacter TaxID=222 RepID=UPI0006C33FE6|nr:MULTISPECIES: Gp138 family membrane-puncturing spike protein [Achromobacter]CUJ98359.1 phage baseplate assembly protein V [Achromobacter sp. 2789STDY5608615]
MDSRERYSDPEEALRAAFRGTRAGIWTSLPGIVQGFDAAQGTVSVQPAIQGVQQAPDGGVAAVEYPLLVDVPVYFPRGGGCTLTFPIAAGDECIVVFSARAIDAWWQSGQAQAPTEPRMHDMADGFALVGPFSQAKMISNVSTAATQLRSNDGSTFFELNPGTQKISIVAPGGLDVTAPLATFSGAVTINGLLTWTAGMIGSIASGVATTISGAINFIGTLTSNGKVIDDRHTHNGVQTGSGNSGSVN